MRGNFQVRFLGEGKAVMSFSYPTLSQNEVCLQESNQRVWVARHLVVLIQTLYGVLYSVGYLALLTLA